VGTRLTEHEVSESKTNNLCNKGENAENLAKDSYKHWSINKQNLQTRMFKETVQHIMLIDQ
jgi:hypothetical protein